MSIEISLLKGFFGAFYVYAIGYSDFSENCIKIKNKEFCNSCWNKEIFNKDWNFCPYKNGTNEEYICSKSITTNMIIDSIKVYINNE